MFNNTPNSGRQPLQFFTSGKKGSSEQAQANQSAQTQTNQDDLNIMHFFSNFSSAQGDLENLLKAFEAENKTTSIFATTKEQLEQLYNLCIDTIMKENPAIGQMPKAFLQEHFLRFSDEQVEEVRELARKYAKINKSDDYRRFTQDQQLEAKTLVEKMIRNNLNNFLAEQAKQKNEVPTMRDYHNSTSQFRDSAVKFEEYLSNQESAILDIISNITQKYSEMIRPFADQSADTLVYRQSAQILSLTNEISLLKNQNTLTLNELARLKEKNSAALNEMTKLNDQKKAAVTEMANLKEKSTAVLNEMSLLKEQNIAAVNDIKKLKADLDAEKEKSKKLQERFDLLRGLFSSDTN